MSTWKIVSFQLLESDSARLHLCNKINDKLLFASMIPVIDKIIIIFLCKFIPELMHVHLKCFG